MTVAELKRALEDYPDEAEVYMSDGLPVTYLYGNKDSIFMTDVTEDYVELG